MENCETPKQAKEKSKLFGVYDTGPNFGDRYTVVWDKIADHNNNYSCFCMNANPTHPQGIGNHSACKLGKHLGKKINFTDLPPECQRAFNLMYTFK